MIESKKKDIFSLKGIITYGKVTEIYDGDTCTANLIIDDKILSYRCRMYGYDSHELKPKLNVKDRDQVIEKAK